VAKLIGIGPTEDSDEVFSIYDLRISTVCDKSRTSCSRHGEYAFVIKISSGNYTM